MAAFRIVTTDGAARLLRAGTPARIWDGAQFMETAPIDVAVRCVTDMAQPGDTLQIDDGPVTTFEAGTHHTTHVTMHVGTMAGGVITGINIEL